MLTSNTFSKRILSPFAKNNRIDQPYQKVEIVNGHSINVELEKFTNFFKQNGNITKKEILSTIIDEVVRKNKKIDNYFYNDYIGNNAETERIRRIINCYDDMNLNQNDMLRIIKFKCKKDRELQFYIRENNGILEVLLVDIYHLGIKSQYHYTASGQKIKFNPDRVYLKNQNNIYDISIIINSQEELVVT